MDKKISILFIILILLLPTQNNSQDKKNGIGIIFLEPTGLSLKISLGDRFSLCTATGKTLGEEETWRIQVDLLFDFKFFESESFYTSLYTGSGGRYELQGKQKFGIRFPIGINVASKNIPVLIFAEGGPILEFRPSMLYFRGAIGLRLLF